MVEPKLLIVDDEIDMAEFVGDVAEGMGFDVEITDCAKGLMALYENNRVAGIVMDVVMPDMDGVELIGWLGQKGCTAPVILISGYDYNELVESIGTNRGVVILGALQKPFTVSDIEGYLSQVLESCQ